MSRHGNHVCSVLRGPLLHCDVLDAYPSLYFEGCGPGRHIFDVVGGIDRRGKEHVLVLMVNLKLLLLHLHRRLLRSKEFRKKT